MAEPLQIKKKLYITNHSSEKSSDLVADNNVATKPTPRKIRGFGILMAVQYMQF